MYFTKPYVKNIQEKFLFTYRLIQSMFDLNDDANKIDFYKNKMQMDDLDGLDILPKKSDRPR